MDDSLKATIAALGPADLEDLLEATANVLNKHQAIPVVDTIYDVDYEEYITRIWIASLPDKSGEGRHAYIRASRRKSG